MKHTDIISEAVKVLGPRGKAYGDVRENHDAIAQLATVLTGKSMSARDIALIMVAVKLSRASTSPDHVDNWVDAINYLSFAGEFSTEVETVVKKKEEDDVF